MPPTSAVHSDIMDFALQFISLSTRFRRKAVSFTFLVHILVAFTFLFIKAHCKTYAAVLTTISGYSCNERLFKIPDTFKNLSARLCLSYDAFVVSTLIFIFNIYLSLMKNKN